MCESCALREVEIQTELSDQVISESSHSYAPVLDHDNRVTELVNRLSKEIPIDARQFHVQEISSIVSVENELAGLIPDKDERAFKLAEIVNDRLEGFKKNLFELKKIEAELRTDMITDQRYLNHLVPSLRAEARKQFAQFDISYQPVSPIKVISAPKVRMSASDRAMNSLATMLGITPEQARKQFESVALTKGITCSCKETPGMCKLHP